MYAVNCVCVVLYVNPDGSNKFSAFPSLPLPLFDWAKGRKVDGRGHDAKKYI